MFFLGDENHFRQGLIYCLGKIFNAGETLYEGRHVEAINRLIETEHHGNGPIKIVMYDTGRKSWFGELYHFLDDNGVVRTLAFSSVLTPDHIFNLTENALSLERRTSSYVPEVIVPFSYSDIGKLDREANSILYSLAKK